ncbi:hypothetical protein Hanom_Chr16g01488081 [Helianthus anomalus]
MACYMKTLQSSCVSNDQVKHGLGFGSKGPFALHLETNNPNFLHNTVHKSAVGYEISSGSLYAS